MVKKRKEATPQQEAAFKADYAHWMDFITRDWRQAGLEYFQRLQETPERDRTALTIGMMRDLEDITQGEEDEWLDAWQKGCNIKTSADAVRYVISNSLLSSFGLGVVYKCRSRYEDIAKVVANLISEEVDFVPMTDQQRRIKLFVEAYGFAVFVID